MTSKLMLFEKQDVLGFMTDFYRDGEGNLYMTRKQIGRCLGYANPDNGVRVLHHDHKDELDEHSKQVFMQVEITAEPDTPCATKPTATRRQKVFVYDEEGIYIIAMLSNQPKARQFRQIVAKILKQLRKGYQVWLLERERGKEVRRSLTDTIRDEYPNSPHKKFMYKNFTDLAYKAVTGKNAKQLKAEYGEPLRDNLPSDVLKRVKATEHVIEGLVELGYDYDKIKGLLNPQLEE